MYLNNNTGPLNARTRRFCRITRDGKKKTLAIVEKSIRNFIFLLLIRAIFILLHERFSHTGCPINSKKYGPIIQHKIIRHR